MRAEPVLVSWSSGKDAAWALGRVLDDPLLSVRGLLTTVNEALDRVAMHAVRRRLLEAQAEALRLPLVVVPLPWPCTNEDYGHRMNAALAAQREAGIRGVVFGDLFLADVRAFREEQMREAGLQAHFPLFGEDTAALARRMIAGGLEARTTCIDPEKLPERFLGRRFDAEFLAELPAGVDPCGENGEFHTFVEAGPMFQRRVPVRTGEVVARDGFLFADLLPA